MKSREIGLLLFLLLILGAANPMGCKQGISGTVTDGGDPAVPIGGAIVTAALTGGATEYTDYADDNGNYSIENVPPGEYAVRASSSGVYSNSETVTVSGMDQGGGCRMNGATADLVIGAGDLPESLVSHWRLDEGAGTSAGDTKDNNDGTFGTGSSSPSWSSSGKYNSCLYFGGDDHVDMGTLTAVTGDTDLSVAVWVKFDKGNMDVTGKIIDCNYYSDYSYKGFQMYFDYASQKVRFACHQNDILGYAAATTDVGDDMWHFLVGVRDRTGSGKFKFYVDGVLDAEGQATHQGDIVASTGNAYYTLGSHCAKTMGYFEGYIDEVMVFDKALSPTEVEYLYENGM